MTKVSVLMSTYNGADYLKEQIDSILNQKGEFELKLIIRDDGSKDETCNIIKNMQDENPDKIILYAEENIGCNAAFFKLLSLAPKSDYYAFSDQDDIWMDDKIQAAVNALTGENPDCPLLYACTSYLVYDDLKPCGTTREKKKEMSMYNSIIQNICPGHNEVMNQKLVDILSKPLEYDKFYFYDSWVSNVANLFGKVVFDNTPHTYYRQHRTQQLGYGKGIIGRLLVSAKHAMKGDGKHYRAQIAYFVTAYEEELKKQGFYDEIKSFLTQNGMWERLFYSFRSKLYRQTKLETVMFKINYIIGNF